MVEQAVQERAVELPVSSTRIDSRKLGVWVFLASEIIFFTALIGGSLFLRITTGEWVEPNHILNVPLTSLNTFILIVSSVTVVESLSAIERGDQRMLKRWLIATALLGVTFLSIQAFEYTQAVGAKACCQRAAPTRARRAPRCTAPRSIFKQAFTAHTSLLV